MLITYNKILHHQKQFKQMDREIVTSKNYSCAVCTSMWTLISCELMDENGEIREMEEEIDGNKRGV